MSEQSAAMHLLTGAYAVNALDPDERADFETHLADCPECAEEVRGLLETTARLASAEAVVPPARLKVAVMAQIANTRQLAPDAEDGTPEGSAEDSAGDAVVVPIRRPGWSWAQRAVGVAAAVLAVIALGLSSLLVQANHQRSQLDAARQAVAQVLTASDARYLSGSVANGGHATIVVSPKQGTSVFLGTGLPAAPAGHTYQLWYMGAGGSVVSAGTFNPDANGHVAEVLDGTIGSASAVGVTVEPAGGSKTPTTKPVFALAFTA
jgi:anti-sigma-K factor RskA